MVTNQGILTENFSLLLTITLIRPWNSTMAGISVSYWTKNGNIKELERQLDLLNYKALDPSLDISMIRFELDRWELLAPENDKARARLLELKEKVRGLLREERRLESQIKVIKERIQAEASKDRQQAQQDPEAKQ